MRPEPRWPIAVMNFIVDDQGRFLFVSPDGDHWRTMGGQLEAGETIPQCVEREIAEELGDIAFRLLDVLDAHVFDYPGMGPMLSLFTLVRFEGGDIVANDDIEGWHLRWVTPQELASLEVTVPHQSELVAKALDVAGRYLEAPPAYAKSEWLQPT